MADGNQKNLADTKLADSDVQPLNCHLAMPNYVSQDGCEKAFLKFCITPNLIEIILNFTKIPENKIIDLREILELFVKILKYLILSTELQCCGSASIIMRIQIRIQDPKNVHVDPDQDPDPDPDPRGKD